MSTRLLKLLLAVLISMTVGFALYPLFFPTEIAEKKPEKKPEPAQIVRDTKVDDWQTDDNDEAWKEEEPSGQAEGPDNGLARQDDDSFAEEDVPEDPKQNKVPESRVHAEFTSSLAAIHQLAKQYERTEAKNFTSDDLPAERWNDPGAVYQELADKVLAQLGKFDEKSILAFMESPENRLDLARITLIRKVGTQGMQNLASFEGGQQMIADICRDLNWMNGILYSGPTKNLEHGLNTLLVFYNAHKDDILKDERCKMIATTTALEFAREGWSDQDAQGRFDFYFNSYKEGKLNYLFNDLQYWDMRLVTGCAEADSTGTSWGGPRNLEWMRDNVRLPADQYLGCEYRQLQYRLRNVAGDSVFSSEYLAPIWDYTNHVQAWAHREIGGVCGALSHYASFGALASGLPAMPMGEPGHCAYALRQGKEWQAGNTIYWQHSLQKTLWGEPEWDFLILMQDLYGTDRFTTMVSDQIVAMADFLGARKKKTASFNCYELALHAQPLNWPAHARYSGYLKLKAPDDLKKWKALHDSVVNGMGQKYYCAAAKMLYTRVYPNLVPLVKDTQVRNRMFSGIFKNFKGWGTNRWEIKDILDAQMGYCTTDKEKKLYLREVLSVLMQKKEYAGSVLTWGLGYVSKMPDDGGKTQEEFSNMIVRSMARAKTNKKDIDDTWNALGEAIAAAETNGERATFQAIGKLAYAKCRSRFAKKRLKMPSFPGKVLSQNGLIKSATTMTDGQMGDSCMHWAVLQRFGGSIPGKFEGKTGTVVQLDSKCDITGVVVKLAEPVPSDKKASPFSIQVSDDGQNWVTAIPECSYKDSFLLFDGRKSKVSGKFVKLIRDADKFEPEMQGFYVYGRAIRN